MSVGLFRNEQHQYFANYDGQTIGPLPSVTKLTSAFNDGKAEALAGAARRDTAAYAVKHLEDIQMLMVQFGQEAAQAHVQSINVKDWAAKGARGTTVHALIEAELRHRYSVEKPPAPHWADEFQPDKKALDNFLKDFPLKVLGVETMVASLSVEYAGTVDLWAEIDGEVHLIDAKTGKWLGLDYILQLAGYANAEFIGRPNDPKRYRMPNATKFDLLHIRPNEYPKGYRLIPYDVGEAEWATFRHIRETHRWITERAPFVAGAPLKPLKSAA